MRSDARYPVAEWIFALTLLREGLGPDKLCSRLLKMRLWDSPRLTGCLMRIPGHAQILSQFIMFVCLFNRGSNPRAAAKDTAWLIVFIHCVVCHEEVDK